MEFLTADQVLALAPDVASANAGQTLADPDHWLSLGRSEHLVWGECPGESSLHPFHAQAGLAGKAFACTCANPLSPCEHGLGLLLLLATDAGRVPAAAAPPAWTAAPPDGKPLRSDAPAPPAPPDPAPAPARRLVRRPPPASDRLAAAGLPAPTDARFGAERRASREKRAARQETPAAAAGLGELQTWLDDLARHGLAHARLQPATYFENMAARMSEAHAPGLARRLRDWPALFASGDRWASRVLEAAGNLQWLLNGAARLDELPAAQRASVRSAIGWNVGEQELLADPGAETVSDHWQIVGQRIEEEDNALRVQRTWLIGEKTRRAALCLSFAAGGQALDIRLSAGLAIDADLTFFPGAAGLRAVLSARRNHNPPPVFDSLPARAGFHDALAGTAALLAADPWLERSPWLIRGCRPALERAAGGEDAHRAESWTLRDADGAAVPLAGAFIDGWPLLALSSGSPVTVFGEWDGRAFLPLSVMAGGRFVALGGGALP